MSEKPKPPEPSPFDALQRIYFKEGQLITADDLNKNCEYCSERLKRHNRLFHGAGVVSGLNLVVSAGTTLKISAGTALDREGNEIVLSEDLSVPIRDVSGGKIHVGVAYEEKAVQVQGPLLSVMQEAPEAFHLMRIQESGRVKLIEENPGPDSRFIILGVLLKDGLTWRLDPNFQRRETSGEGRRPSSDRPLPGTTDPASRKKIPWYFQTSIIVIAILTIGPFALPFVWWHPSYSRTKKITISVIVIVLSFYLTKAFIGAMQTLHEYYKSIFSMM